MANIYSGIYTKLKDRNCDIKDRLKLAKFAWFSDKVILPNKEQVLIDFLSGLLLNKKRSNVSENETCLVWRCLYEVLQSKKCHSPGKSRQTLIIKPSICQVLCNSILLECKKNSGCTADIVGCALAIIRSPTLSYVFTSKYDFLVRLLSNVLQLVVQTIKDDRVIPPDYIQLLQRCTSAYSVSQRAHPQQEKVFQSVVDCLLSPILLLENATEKYPELKVCAEILTNVLDQALFHKEHHPFYENFLSSVVGKDETKHKVSKTIESFFHSLSNLLSKQKGKDCNTDTDKMASRYLIVFFENFLSYKCHGDKPLTSFRLFVHICGLLGVKDDTPGLCKPPLSEQDVVAVVSSLLRSLLKHDIYSQPQDAAEDNVQLKFYSHVLVVVLQHRQSSSFFSCLESLLELNHVILEAKMTEVIQIAWLEESAEELTGKRLTFLENFVTKLFNTYSKLRQIPKLLNILLTSLNGKVPHSLRPLLSERISIGLGEIVEGLPQTVAVEVWRLLLKAIEEYLPKLGREGKKFLFVAEIFAVFLSNVKIADYTITHLTRSKVKEVMADTQLNVLTPLAEIVTSEKAVCSEPIVFSTLLLSYSWGELCLLLEEFVPESKRSGCHQQNVYKDLEAVFTISSNTWKELHTIATSTNQKRDLYLWKLLTTLVLKAVLVNKGIEQSSEYVSEILLRLFSDVDKSFGEDECVSYGMLWEISTQNYNMASLDLGLSMVPLCGTLLAHKTTQQITDLVVHIMVHRKTKSRCDVHSQLLDKCQSPEIQESWSWLSCMMTSALQALPHLIRENQNTPRKKRRPNPSSLEAVMNGLCDSVFTTADKSEQMKKLQHISNLVNEGMLSDEGKCLQEVETSSLVNCIQIIAVIQQSDHSPEEKLRGFLGGLALLSQGISSEGKTKEEMLDKIITLLIQIVEKVGQVPVFHLLDINSYICWLNSIIHGKKKTFSWGLCRKFELFLEMSCRVMVTDFQILPKLLNIITKELQDSQEVPCFLAPILKETSQLSNRSYLKGDVISLCQTAVSQVYLNLQPLYATDRKSAETLTVSHVHVMSAIVGILPKDQILQGNINCVYQFCLKVLDNPEEDVLVTSASLGFLESLCLCIDTKKDLLSSEQKIILWRTLKKLFYDFFINGNRQKKTVENSHLGREAVEKPLYFTDDHIVSPLQDREKEQSWHWMKKKMIFDGCLSCDGRKLVFKQIQSTIGALVFSLDTDQFQIVIETLLSDCSLRELVVDDFCHMLASLHLWNQVIQNELTEEKGSVVVRAVDEMMINFQSAIIQLKDIKEEGIFHHLVVPLLTCQSDMLNFGPALMSSQCATMALQSCGYIPSCILSHYPAFLAVCGVLTSLIVHHTETIFKVIPTFISCANHILFTTNVFDRIFIVSGHCDTLIDKDSINDAKQCAHLLNKLYALMASHKPEFSKVAVYMVANYVTEIQKVTLHPVVKRALLPAVYAVLDICDTHAVSQLHVVLNQDTNLLQHM
uniref:Nucleolar 27S pre-rRNA processing Urb2/Npa2 C-terminal domain-containing protein n=1 Tax=Magallana gigas TaxID=29159 RepID=A0A8W8LUW4_MAGGI